MLKKAFNNFPSATCQHILRFNYGLANLMLNQYEEAIRSFVSILDEVKSTDDRSQKLVKNSVHNLIFAVCLRNSNSVKHPSLNLKDL